MLLAWEAIRNYRSFVYGEKVPEGLLSKEEQEWVTKPFERWLTLGNLLILCGTFVLIGYADGFLTGGLLGVLGVFLGLVVFCVLVLMILAIAMFICVWTKRALGGITTGPVTPRRQMPHTLRWVAAFLVSLAAIYFCAQTIVDRTHEGAWSRLAWPGLSFNFEIKIAMGRNTLFWSDWLFAACVTWLAINLSAAWRAWRKPKAAIPLNELESAS